MYIKYRLLINTIYMADSTFKKYDPYQPTFLPPSLDSLLAGTHIVRFVNHVIDPDHLNKTTSVLKSLPFM